MALPLKSGADFYTQEIRRVALQNEGSDLPEYLSGSIYFNTNSESNTSDRIRYRGRNAWHSVANLEDIARLEGLIADLGDVSGGNITDLLNKIEALEGNFTDGAANDSLKLAGQLPSYYATASGLSALQEKVSAFLDGEADSDAVLENLKEIQAFLDSYDGATSLADMFGAVNTQIADRYTKGEVDTKLSAYRLLTNGVFDVLVNAKNGIETDEITIGGIKLSVVEGQLQIDGDAFATGQLASGGIGEAGSGSGASGIVILEDWSKYDDSVAQVVGAVLGKDLHDRLGVAESTLESLVGKATNVSVVQTLTSGKEIGAITIDGVATKLYAPATYAWGEITSKPTTLAGYGITDAMAFYSSDYYNVRQTTSTDAVRLTFSDVNGLAFGLGRDADKTVYLTSYGEAYGVQFGPNGLRYNDNVSYKAILHEGNYASVLNNAYLKLSGGNLSGAITMNYGAGNVDNAYAAIFVNASATADYGTRIDHRWDGGTTCFRLAREGVYFGSGGNGYPILHSGNFNSYAPTLTGVGASGTWGIDISGSAAMLGGRSASQFVHNSLLAGRIDANATGGTTTAFYSEYRWDNTPASTIGTLLETFYSAGWKSQLFIPIQRGENKIYFRHYSSTSTDNVWGDWKTVAFTDSNVASATKLATARSIWGQSFDGTADVSGNLKLNQGDFIQAVLNGTSYNLMGVTTGGAFEIGRATAQAMLGTTLNGYRLYLQYGTTQTTGLVLNDKGGVTIGASDLATISCKLYVDGNLKLTRGYTIHASDREVISLGENSLIFGRGYAWAGLSTTIAGYNIFFSYGGGPTTGMILNSSGNVTIGASDLASTDYKFYVNAGKVRFASVAGAAPTLGTMSNMAVVVGQADYGMQSYVLGNGSAHIQVGRFDGTATAYSLCLNPLGGNVGIGTASPQYKLHVAGGSLFGTESGVKIRLNDGSIGIAGTTYQRFIGGYSNDYSSLLGGLNIYVASNALQLLWLGTNSERWFSADARYSTLEADWRLYAKAGLTVSTGQTLKIGDATLSWDSTSNALKVDKDFYSDGQVSSGGVAEEGTGGAVGGSGLERVVFTIPANTTTFDCVHNLGTREISVAIYEEGNDYQQILTDVYLDSTNIARVVFGSATDVAHKVVIIG